MNAQHNTNAPHRMRETVATLKLLVPDGFSEADVQKAVDLLVKAGATAAQAALRRPALAHDAQWAACVKVDQIFVKQRRFGATAS
jgi:hypothetical protein